MSQQIASSFKLDTRFQLARSVSSRRRWTWIQLPNEYLAPSFLSWPAFMPSIHALVLFWCSGKAHAYLGFTIVLVSGFLSPLKKRVRYALLDNLAAGLIGLGAMVMHGS